MWVKYQAALQHLLTTVHPRWKLRDGVVVLEAEEMPVLKVPVKVFLILTVFSGSLLNS